MKSWSSALIVCPSLAAAVFVCFHQASREPLSPARTLPNVAGVGDHDRSGIAGPSVTGAATTGRAGELLPAPAQSPADDIRSALERIRSEPDPLDQNARMEAFVQNLSPDEIPRVLQMLSGTGSKGWERIAGDLRRRLIRLWSELDLHALVNWAGAMEPGESRREAIELAASQYASRDSAGAVEWARQFPAGGERDAVCKRVVAETIRATPAEALSLLMDLPDTSERAELMVRASSEWAGKAPEEAVQWARQIPDQDLRERVVSGVAVAWSDRSPAEAATLAVEAVRPGRRQEDAVISIISAWAQQDPAAAVEWALRFPESGLRETALEGIVKQWAQSGPKVAPGWLQSLPQGALRNQALRALR